MITIYNVSEKHCIIYQNKQHFHMVETQVGFTSDSEIEVQFGNLWWVPSAAVGV